MIAPWAACGIKHAENSASGRRIQMGLEIPAILLISRIGLVQRRSLAFDPLLYGLFLTFGIGILFAKRGKRIAQHLIGRQSGKLSALGFKFRADLVRASAPDDLPLSAAPRSNIDCVLDCLLRGFGRRQRRYPWHAQIHLRQPRVQAGGDGHVAQQNLVIGADEHRA